MAGFVFLEASTTRRSQNRNIIEFPVIWEHLNSLDFKPIEFEGIRKLAVLNCFVLTTGRFIERTWAIIIVSIMISGELDRDAVISILETTATRPHTQNPLSR